MLYEKMSTHSILEMLKKFNSILKYGFIVAPKENLPKSDDYFHSHGDIYVNKLSQSYLHDILGGLAREIVQRLIGKKIDIIIVPRKELVGIAMIVADNLYYNQEITYLPIYWGGRIAFCWTEEKGGSLVIPEFMVEEIKMLKRECNALIIGDLEGDGSSTHETAQAVKRTGTRVAGIFFLTAKKIIMDGATDIPIAWLNLLG